MGPRYLVDSNTIIDYLNGILPQEGKNLLFQAEPLLSVITQIEVFGFSSLSLVDKNKLNIFIDTAIIYDIDQPIAVRTIELRIKYKIKLPDALIAATALHYDLALVTRNVSDFNKIEGLKVINPYSI